MTQTLTYQTQKLDHHGIVAGVCKHIDLNDKINEYVDKGQNRKVSCGDAVVAMVINALGLTAKPLYLVAEYMQNKPIDLLLGAEFSADDFNDDTLGRALDDIYETGVTGLFHSVACHAFHKYGVPLAGLHVDTTSFSFHGEYNTEESAEELQEPTPVKVTRGFSKDHRPDLKQVVISLITANRSALPLWLEVLDGNTSDNKSFPKTVTAFCEQFDDDEQRLFIMDSSWYSAENIVSCPKNADWITRVPETIGEAKNLLRALDVTSLKLDEKGYGYTPVSVTYGGVQQRWLLVYSQAGYLREIKTLERRVVKASEQAKKRWKKLKNQQFGCEADALEAMTKFNKGLKYHKVVATVETMHTYATKGRPKKGSKPKETYFVLAGELEKDEKAVEMATNMKGKFIVATNILSSDILSGDEVLSTYKSQGSSVERGFRFLKDPMFFADALFVKKPERIMALIMVMALSLLIYSLAERELRQSLLENNEALPDQKGNPTQCITMRRVIQMFEGVDVLLISINDVLVDKQVLNLSAVHQKILGMFNVEVQKRYLLYG